MTKIGSRELLMQTFMEISREKNVRKITIRELAERSGLSKPTFYKHFADKNDLIYQICYEVGLEALRQAAIEEDTFEGAISFFYHRALDLDYFFRSFRYDVDLRVLLYKSIYASSEEYIHGRLANITKPLSRDIEVAIVFYSAGCSHIFLQWISNNMKETPENMAASIYQCFPEPINRLINFEAIY